MKWDTVIEHKAVELGRYLAGRSSKLDFLELCAKLIRDDHQQLRTHILSLSQLEARRLGIGKSTLHHLPRNAEGQRGFKLYDRVRTKLQVQH